MNNDLRAGEFADWRRQPDRDGKINIVDNLYSLVSGFQSFVQSVCPELGRQPKDMSWLRERTILTSKNDTTAHINDFFFEGFIAETEFTGQWILWWRWTTQCIILSSSCTSLTLQTFLSTASLSKSGHRFLPEFT